MRWRSGRWPPDRLKNSSGLYNLLAQRSAGNSVLRFLNTVIIERLAPPLGGCCRVQFSERAGLAELCPTR